MSLFKKIFGLTSVEDTMVVTDNLQPRRRSTQVYFNGDFFYVEILLDYGNMPDRGASHCDLKPDVSNQVLGETILQALGQFGQLPESEEEQYRASGGAYEKQKYQDMIKRHGYKNKTVLLQNMLNISIYLEDGIVEFQPSFTTGLGNWPATTELDDAVVRLPDTATAEEVGKAARLALKGCRNTYGAKKGLPEHNFDAFLK